MPPCNFPFVHGDLSYRIIGILFDVYNELGPGHRERYYQKAVAEAFRAAGIQFREQVYTPLIFRGSRIGAYYLDFLVDGKVVVELKCGDRFSRRNIEQVYAYLKANGLALGILANFARDGVKLRRIVNLT